MNLLITGGNGYIAKSLNHSLSQKYQITSVSRSDFDLTNHQQTCEWFDGKTFDVVIHTAISGGSRLQLDDSCVFDNNMAMFNNLIANQKSFSKLISFGSGAEIFHGDTPYANSKREIAKQIEKYDNFYNLRIFGLFDENELNTRFIKANLIRYLKKEPMVIHQNKIMDFFYMKDFITLVQHFIENDKLDKQINCSYSHKYSLKNIANFINVLGEHKVPIVIDNKDEFDFYCGDSELPIQTIGLHIGILNTYKCLLENNNYA
jgi:GDP-L-fucose synthase